MKKKDLNKMVLTRTQEDEPYLPEVNIEHYSVRGYSGHRQDINISAVIRWKGEDGLYRDVICRDRHSRPYSETETNHQSMANMARVVSVAIGKMYLVAKLGDYNHLPPSEYQMDETERLTLLHKL